MGTMGSESARGWTVSTMTVDSDHVSVWQYGWCNDHTMTMGSESGWTVLTMTVDSECVAVCMVQ